MYFLYIDSTLWKSGSGFGSTVHLYKLVTLSLGKTLVTLAVAVWRHCDICSPSIISLCRLCDISDCNN